MNSSRISLQKTDVATRQHRGGARRSTSPAPDTYIGSRTARGRRPRRAKGEPQGTHLPEAGYDDHTDPAPTTPEPLLLSMEVVAKTTRTWRRAVWRRVISLEGSSEAVRTPYTRSPLGSPAVSRLCATPSMP